MVYNFCVHIHETIRVRKLSGELIEAQDIPYIFVEQHNCPYCHSTIWRPAIGPVQED